MSTLSVLYVVRNEEGFIKKSIESILPIADEIIVIDTGSMDKTSQICHQYPKVLLKSYSWVHDFSKVRNFGLKQCTKDWVMYLDADEFVDRRSLATIKRAVDAASPTITAFSVRIAAHDTEWSAEAPECDPYFDPFQIRIFRRHPTINFEGRVAENVRRTVESLGAIDLLQANFHHFLWRGKGEGHARLKTKYYKQLGSTIPEPVVVDKDIPQATPLPKKEPAKLAIIMCAFNCLKETQSALQSIQRFTSNRFDLYFTVNGCSDNTANYVRDQFPYAIVSSFPKNEGAAKGKNISLIKAIESGSEYLCICDNDIIIGKESLDRMMSILDDNPNIGAVGPLSSGCDGMQSVVNQLSVSSIEEASSACHLRKPIFLQTDFLNGFCLMVRSSVFKRVGIFDDSFGLYGYDDQDFCLRLKDANIDMAIANQCYVDHARRKTISVMNNIDWHSILTTSGNRFKQKWNKAPIHPRGVTLKQNEYSFKPKTSIVILTHNRLDMTRDCLESIHRCTKNFELVIVDNASKDGTPAFVRAHYPNTKIIENTENLGVPKARNQGIIASTCDFIVMMDNDVIVREGWLDDLYASLNKGADIAGIEAWQINKEFAACHKCVSLHEKFDYLGGACCIYRKSVFEQIGLLDEGFSPAYYEDCDLIIRATKAGLKLAWNPSVKIKHREHQTLIHGQKDFNYQQALATSYERFKQKMNGTLRVEEKKLMSEPKKLRILYLGMEFDYGIPERGLSFEHDNFFPALNQYKKAENVLHFDFVKRGQEIGIPRMTNELCDIVQKFCPDAIFSIFFDEQHDPIRNIFQKISATTPAKSIGWFCDSHYRYDSFDRKWAPFLDYCVTTSTMAIGKYQRDGFGSKVIKSQWGLSPKYKNMPWLSKDIQVSFVGQPHGDRRQVVDKLKQAGIPVQVYGTGWSRRLSFDEMIETFNRSKINLNLNNSCDRTAKQIKGRNFEVPGCGGFLLTGDAENLKEYYEFGKEIVVYSSVEDMIEKIKYYLKNEAEREDITKAGYERTIRDHTYEKRFDEIFRRAGVL